MKLAGSKDGLWQYLLPPNEAEVLAGLLKKFPFTNLDPVKITRNDPDPKSREREKVLNEALAEHRKELQRLAQNLVGPDKFKRQADGVRLTLSSEERETLLQILNDIRVGCWRALGEPEELQADLSQTSGHDHAYRNLMDIAGYFEGSLIVTES
jgi:hypothetical protein